MVGGTKASCINIICTFGLTYISSKMETRKLMRLGRSSLVVSLPNKWIKMNKLKKGDIIYLTTQKDGSLLISPGVRKEKPHKEITLVIKQEEDESFIARKIIACYLNGYGAIELVSSRFFSSRQQRAIKKVATSLKMSIMEANPKRIYLETLLDESKVSVDRTLRRIHMIVLSMCQGIGDVMKEWDMGLARSIYTLDDEVDQFTFLLLRLFRMCVEDPMLMSQVGIKAGDCLDFRILALKLEHIADCSADIAWRLLMLDSMDQRLPEHLLEFLIKKQALACKTYEESMRAFFSLNTELADRIIDSIGGVEELNREVSRLLMDERNPAVVCTFCHLRDNIEKIFEYSVDIAELVIDRSYYLREE